MAKDTKKPAAGAAGSEQKPNAAAAGAPAFNIVGQYTRDLSFEVPGAPQSITGLTKMPGYNVGINVQVKKQTDEQYAVELSLNAKAEMDGTLLYNVELVYGGIFRVRNIAENQLPPLLMIECPRMLFPFARQVIASVTQSGGVPPLFLEPVDFVALYQQNLANMAKNSAAAGQAQPEKTS